jgi:putative Mg2+ transporter-C (MgtC) family protein
MYQRQLQILGEVALAMLLGAVLGLEREIAHKPAGLRTHMMVAGAAALLVALGDIIVRHFDARMGQTVVQSDPLRIIEAVITGVSFLGAGTIIRRCSLDIGYLTCVACIFAMVGVALVSTECLGVVQGLLGGMSGGCGSTFFACRDPWSAADGMAFAQQKCQCSIIV